jgi:BioD-like phosphotransacetylase family protein
VKSIYIPSVERFSGKTATCLALGKRLQADGNKVGYLKPLSFEPWRMGDKIADEDVAFAVKILGLGVQPWEISPVVVTPELLRSYLRGKHKEDLFQRIKDAYEKVRKTNEVILIEGGGSLREGHVVGLPTAEVAQTLESDVLVVVKYRGDIRLMDDTLAAQTRLGNFLRGVIINRVPADANDFVIQDAVPYFEKLGIPILGIIPESRLLETLTVQELYDVLDAELLTESYEPEAFVETLTIGAMTAEAALRRFRKQSNKVVITGGDRSDIQLAALETSTTCLVLTGNLHPSPLIIKQAEDLGVSIFLVSDTTMETIETIERVFGKTRLGQLAKLEQFEKLFSEHVDLKKLYKVFGLKS